VETACHDELGALGKSSAGRSATSDQVKSCLASHLTKEDFQDRVSWALLYDGMGPESRMQTDVTTEKESWFSRHGDVGLTAGLGDLRVLFQPS